MPSQSSTPPQPRHRGDMYSRAEERYRAELAAERLQAENAAAAAAAAELTPIVNVKPAAPAEPLLVPLPPTAVPAAVPPAPLIEAPIALVDLPSEVAPPTMKASPVLPRKPRKRRAQSQLTLVAAFGALAVAAVLGIIFTLLPDKAAPPAVTRSAVPVTPAAQPRPASAPAPVATIQTSSPAPARPGAESPQPPVAAPSQPPVVQAARVENTVGTAGRAFATEGRLRVTSTPSGARVTINGIGWGQTPVTIDHLPLGTKTVRITRDGYAAQERSVQISGGQASQSLSVTLARR